MSEKNRNPIVKPFLKWAGGKRQLMAEIKNHLPKQYKKYYEVFIGAGALLFEIQPNKAVINDTNKQLINCYQVIRDYPEELIKDLQNHQNQADYFYQIRAIDRHSQDYQNLSPIQQASRIIYLNKTCYNGLFRVNSQGQFNVPFGAYKNPEIVNESVIRAVSQYLKNNHIEIKNADFAQALTTAKKDDFIYLDPPYDPVSDTAAFTGYDIKGFNKDEQIRLKKTVDSLHKKGCLILLSNSYTDFIRELYDEPYYQHIKISAMRAINSKGDKRGKVDEILIKNYH